MRAKDLEYVRARVASFAGYMKHCDGYHSTMAILDGFVLGKQPGKPDPPEGSGDE